MCTYYTHAQAAPANGGAVKVVEAHATATQKMTAGAEAEITEVCARECVCVCVYVCAWGAGGGRVFERER